MNFWYKVGILSYIKFYLTEYKFKTLTEEDVERIPVDLVNSSLAGNFSFSLINQINTIEQNTNPNLLDKNDECAICLDLFKLNDRIKRLPCSHVYHAECIGAWIKNVILIE